MQPQCVNKLLLAVKSCIVLTIIIVAVSLFQSSLSSSTASVYNSSVEAEAALTHIPCSPSSLLGSTGCSIPHSSHSRRRTSENHQLTLTV